MVDAEKELQDYLEEIAKDNKYENGHIEVRAISSGGANYTSDLYLATISSPPKHDLKLFAKVANIGESLLAENDVMTSVYDTERIFYTELAVAFNGLYDRHGAPEKNRLYITKFYGFKLAKLGETLVLGNLVAKGFGSFDRMKTFNWDYHIVNMTVIIMRFNLWPKHRKSCRNQYNNNFQNGKMEVVPLDYQTLRSGKLVTDLVYFIWTSSDSQFRKLYYSHLLEHYYGALTQALRDLGVDVNKVYPRELFEQELEETKTSGLYIGLTMMPILTVDTENAPNMDDVMNFSLAPNQLAVDRMNDIIGDYVRRGVI